MKKNDYELYKKACCGLYLYIKVCSESEEQRACFVLFNALINDKSQGFLNVVKEIISNEQEPSRGDIMVYVLLMSVRVDSDLVRGFLLDTCDEIQGEILNKMVEEGKK